MSYPLVNKFLCVNNSGDTIIYPAIFDVAGTTPLWDSNGDASYAIQPLTNKVVDLSIVNISEGTNIVLGCHIKDTTITKNDPTNPKQFSTKASSTATGTFTGSGIAGKFTVNATDSVSTDSLEAGTLSKQANGNTDLPEPRGLFKESNVLVTAQFLRSVANLMSVDT